MGVEKAIPEATRAIDADEPLRKWRASAVRFVLLVIAVSGLLSWGSVLNNDISVNGATSLTWVYVASYLAFVLLALLPRIDYRVRAWGLIALGYMSAVASFARVGLVGSGRLYLLTVPVFATLLLGWRVGILATIISLAIYWPIANLAGLHGFGEWDRLLSENPGGLNRWGESGMALMTFLFAVMAMVVSFQRLARRTLEAHQKTSNALEQAYQSMEQRVGERTRELAAVNAIAAVVSRSLDLNSILVDALSKTLEVTSMELGLAYRLEESKPGEAGSGRLYPLAHRGLPDAFFPNTTPLNLEASKVMEAVETGLPVVWDPRAYPNPVTRRAIEEEGVRLLISIPLLAKDRLVGALLIGSRQSRLVSAEELAMLSAIGQQVAMAVENARLYDQVQQTAHLEERNRLARELHDSVTQSLYSMTLYAEAAARLFNAGDTQTAVEHLRELRDTSREALREMRLLIYELRPPALETGGLAGALQARLEAVEARAGLRTEFEVEGDDHLSSAVQDELYHIAREALNNLLKHAKAHSVRVHLSFQKANTLLEVCDDGVGFNPDEVRTSGGLGISGMKERAQRIGACLEIKSAPNEGTTVNVVTAGNGR